MIQNKLLMALERVGFDSVLEDINEPLDISSPFEGYSFPIRQDGWVEIEVTICYTFKHENSFKKFSYSAWYVWPEKSSDGDFVEAMQQTWNDFKDGLSNLGLGQRALIYDYDWGNLVVPQLLSSLNDSIIDNKMKPYE